ncbi:MAG: hypothetical protein E7258_02325 [Lachnospiraceae bacterium]|nr:hypothetical protein [Lachnospiraceae bacterium]
MADKEKEMLEDIKDEKLKEDIEEYIEDDYDEDGYEEHQFSLFDNPLEIATVAFMAIFFIFKVWNFVEIFDTFIDTMAMVEYFLGVAADLVPAVVLLVACEIYEKMEYVEYNLKINSFYMSRYHEDTLEALGEYGEYDEEEVEETEE